MNPSFALLGILGQGPSYGYDLKKNYDTLFGREKPLAFGQVYATLARLLRDEKISIAISQEQSEGPERKEYTITPAGRQELEQWLQKPEILNPNLQTALYTKVVAAILLDKNPDVFLDAQRSEHLKQMRSLTNTRRSGDLSQMLLADYALFHLEADIRWIDMTSARIQALKEEITNGQN